MELGDISTRLLGQLISGITYGSVYGLFGLAIVFLYRANKLFNFATTEIATFFAISMFFFLKHMSYISAFVLTISLSLLAGSLLHLAFMRVITERRTVLHSGETIVTIGLLTILNSLSSLIDDQAESFQLLFLRSY